MFTFKKIFLLKWNHLLFKEKKQKTKMLTKKQSKNSHLRKSIICAENQAVLNVIDLT